MAPGLGYRRWVGARASSDVELLTRWREGDAVAGNELVRRYLVGVHRYFHARLPEDADDLTQRTFETCIGSRDRVRDDAAFRGFLFGVARNLLLQRLSALPRERAIEPLADERPELLISSPSRAFAQADQLRLLIQVVGSLPDDLRPVVQQYYLDERPLLAIAEELGIPVGTVKSRLSRARALLRQRLSSLEPAPLVEQTIEALERASQAIDATG